MRAIHRWESGFTLIEMMVVLTIVGILSAIATVALGTGSSRAYVTAMQADLRNVVTAQEAFVEETFAATGRATYARRVSDLDVSLSNGVTVRLRGNANGWSARVTHARVSGTRCAVFRGTIKAFPPATDEGKITCD